MRYIWDKKLQKMVEASQYRRVSEGPIVVKDIEPYQSMHTGERIRSRSHHREHIRDHNLIELGNEMPKEERHELPPSRMDIARAIHELKNR